MICNEYYGVRKYLTEIENDKSQAGFEGANQLMKAEDTHDFQLKIYIFLIQKMPKDAMTLRADFRMFSTVSAVHSNM